MQIVLCAAFDQIAADLPAAPAPDGYAIGEGLCYDGTLTGSVREGVLEAAVEGDELVAFVRELELASGDLSRDLDEVA